MAAPHRDAGFVLHREKKAVVLFAAPGPGRATRAAAPRPLASATTAALVLGLTGLGSLASPPPPPVVTAPAPNSVVAVDRPTFTGTGRTGDTVTASTGTTVLGTDVVDAGDWSISAGRDLPTGENTLSFSAASPAGDVGDPTTVTFFVDSSPPAAAVIATPADGSARNVDPPRFTGSGDLGTRVDLLLDGESVGTDTVDSSGTWSIIVTDVLGDGEVTITPRATDSLGTSSTGDPVTVTIDTVAPALPVITSPRDGSAVDVASAAITGTAEADTTLVVLDAESDVVGAADVAVDGTWTVDLTGDIGEGSYTVSPRSADAAGNVTTGRSVTFEVDTTAPAPAAKVRCVADQDGSVTCAGTAEASATVVIATGGLEVCRTQVGTAGGWSCTSGAPVPGRSVTVGVMDPAGNASSPGDVVAEPPGTLPDTGAHVWSLIAAGLLCLALGTGLIVRAHRPARREAVDR